METTQTKTKCVLYARKSTEEDDQQIMSIEAQLFELREYASREHIEIVKEFTEAKSAKKPGRDGFAKMIEYIESSSERLGILAWHPDRLARNSVDGGKIIYLSRHQQNCFFALSDSFGLSQLRKGNSCCKWRSDKANIFLTTWWKM